MIDDGNPRHYHEWEFRTMSKYLGTKDEDRTLQGPRVLEGLRGEAYLVAEDLGLEKLAEKDGIKVLIEAMRLRVFPPDQHRGKRAFPARAAHWGTPV